MSKIDTTIFDLVSVYTVDDYGIERRKETPAKSLTDWLEEDGSDWEPYPEGVPQVSDTEMDAFVKEATKSWWDSLKS